VSFSALAPAEQRETLQTLHNEQNLAVYRVAKELRTTPETLHRIAEKIGFVLRPRNRTSTTRKRTCAADMRAYLLDYLFTVGNPDFLKTSEAATLIGLVEAVVNVALGKVTIAEYRVEKVKEKG
jgi:hypothetical protein